MDKIVYPNVIEHSDLILNTTNFNFSSNELRNIIVDLCKKASIENKMQLVNVYFLNDGSKNLNDHNCIGKIQLPIFPHTFNIDENIFDHVERIYTESHFLFKDLNLLDNHKSAFGKPVSLIFREFPKLCEQYIISFSNKNINKLNNCINQMREIAKTMYPKNIKDVERYITVCIDKTNSLTNLFKHFTTSCNGKQNYNGDFNPNLKFDTTQVERLLNHIYNNFNEMFYVASEWCHEENERALKSYKIYDDAEAFFVKSSNPYNSKVYDAAFAITTNVLEMAGISDTMNKSQPGNDDNN